MMYYGHDDGNVDDNFVLIRRISRYFLETSKKQKEDVNHKKVL